MKWFCSIVWICLSLRVVAAGAPAASPAAEGNRFLFVVDASSSMKKLALPERQAVFDMIFTGFYQQMNVGDTYGLWTFSEQPCAGIYPMQKWKPEQAMDLASHAAKFLRSQRYSGQARVAILMQKVGAVIAAVKNVTILIVSDSATQITGTPFDSELQLAYAYRAAEQREAQQPLVTALIAQHGEIISASVHVAGNPILLIATPDDSSTLVECIPRSTGTPSSTHPPIAGATNRTPATTAQAAPEVPPPQLPGATAKPPRKRIIEIRNVKHTGTETNASPAPVALTVPPGDRPVRVPETPHPGLLSQSPPAGDHPTKSPAADVIAGEREPVRGKEWHRGAAMSVAARDSAQEWTNSPAGPLALAPGALTTASGSKARTLFLTGGGLLGLMLVALLIGLRRIRPVRREASYITRSLDRTR